MPKNVVARKETGWKVVSIAPDVCKTPMGSSTPAVPYQVTAELDSAVQVVPSVRANGHPVLVFDMSLLPNTIGDAAGSATGIKSGTVEGKCYPKAHSDTVRADRKWLVRHDDKFWMNGK
jgi:hypothetical protein